MKLIAVSKNLVFVLAVAVGSLVLGNPDKATVAEYEAPALTESESWSLILLPDTQSYVKFGRNQPLLDLMMEWILENKELLNIQMVLCTGDLVEHNELLNPTGPKVNQSSPDQWEAVSRSFGRLDGKIPYVLATGNHDYGVRNAENRVSNFPRYFPVNKNFLNQRLLREVGFNAQGTPSLENAAYAFHSPHGEDFLFLSLEFAPRESTLEWAGSVVNDELYQDHKVIMLTHHFLSANSERSVWDNQYPLEDANFGEEMWMKLVQPASNIRLVINGHIGGSNDAKAHLGFRVDPNAADKPVYQMAFNAQALGGGWYGNGGDGWLRILEFLPDGKTVKVRTFSPLFAISPTSQEHAWRRDPWDEFSFEIE